MEMTVHEVVLMSRMGNGFVTAPRAMPVLTVVSAALMRIALRRRVERVFVDVIAVRVVKMAVVQIIDMVSMLKPRVTAAFTMNVLVVVVRQMLHVSRVPRHRRATQTGVPLR
jgi:hypothetical protein